MAGMLLKFATARLAVLMALSRMTFSQVNFIMILSWCWELFKGDSVFTAWQAVSVCRKGVEVQGVLGMWRIED